MVIAMLGHLTLGYRCVGPFICTDEAVAYCGSDCYIMGIATFPYRGTNCGPILIIGNMAEGFYAAGPFEDNAQLEVWKRAQPAREGVVYLLMPLQTPNPRSFRGSDC